MAAQVGALSPPIKLPDFFIIGAGRCGTTSLYHYLNQHPDIFMSEIKETNFYSYEADDHSARDKLDHRNLFPVRTLEEYQALFRSARSGQMVGEASPQYFYRPNAAERIQRAVPNAKLVAILRNPVDRAYAGYMMYVRDGLENRSFEVAVRDELEGINVELPSAKWHNVGVGFYHRHLMRFVERFGRDQLATFLYDDFARQPADVAQGVFRFLRVDDGFAPDTSVRHNAAGVPRNRLLHSTLKSLSAGGVNRAVKACLPAWAKRRAREFAISRQQQNLVKPPLPKALREELKEIYRDDIEKLEELLELDLSAWLAEETADL